MAMRKAAVAAIGVVVVMGATFLLLRSFQSKYVFLRAYTDDAGGLGEGTAVRLNGIGVGELDKLNLTTSRDPQRKIEFIMKVDRRFLHEIPDDSLVGVAATNLLGNYFIDIIQGRSRQSVLPGGELKTTISVDPNKLMGQMANELQQIQSIFARANQLLQDIQSGQGNLGKWQKEGVSRIDALSAEAARLSRSIQNSHGNLSKLDELSAQLKSPQARLDNVLSELQPGHGTAGQLSAFSAEVTQMNAEMSQLTADLNSPRGPAARLTKMQESFGDLTTRFQSTMDRMNAGQGTLGQLSVNPQFSAALANTSAEFQALAKSIRANPRQFLRLQVRLF